MKQLWTGEDQSTLTNQAINTGLQKVGVSSENAQAAANYTEFGMSLFLGGGVAPKAFPGMISASKPVAATPGLFRRGGNNGAFAGFVVPMELRTVKAVAKQSGVGLNGVKLKIIHDRELIGRNIFGYAHKKTITLYPDAFGSYETLVKTLGHERTHLFQFS